jgi:hypothetical protein
MAPPTWHNDEHKAFFSKHMPNFVDLQGKGKLYKFWGPTYEAWFQQFPEHASLGFPLPSAEGDAADLTQEQFDALGEAIIARKKVSSIPFLLATRQIAYRVHRKSRIIFVTTARRYPLIDV